MIVGALFSNGSMYVFLDDALLVYDESSVVDFNGNYNNKITKTVELNPVNFDESYLKLQNVYCTYDSSEDLSIGVQIDSGVTANIAAPAGTNVHIEKRLPRAMIKRGLRFSFSITTMADVFILKEFVMLFTKTMRKAGTRG